MANNDDLSSLVLNNTQSIDGDHIWVPSRRVAPVWMSDLQDQFNRVRRIVLPAPTATTTTAIPDGPPQQVTAVSATESPFKTQDGTMRSNVSVSFTANPSDPFFDHVQIWFTGYNGNALPQLMPGDSHSSPASFLCDTTHETVTVTVVAVGSTGIPADITFAPATTVILDGVISAPAAPTVTQTALPIFGGIQFSFSQLTGLAADAIQCYKIYRNTTNSSGTATVVDTIAHDSKNAGITTTFQDSNIVANVVYYYWVTAVNTSALESTFTSAGNTTGNFSIPVETINLFANPATQGTGNLPALNVAVPEQWQYNQSGGSTSIAEYRNGRDIRIPFSSSGTCGIGQLKGIMRFKPGQVATFSLRLRRDTSVGSPTGTVNIQILPVDDAGVGFGSAISVNVNLSDLSGIYKLYKVTATLTLMGGQGQWFFSLYNMSTNCDVFMTEPMLNSGLDAAPFTTNSFLTDVPQYAFEGAAFVSDDFTDTNGTTMGYTLGGSSHRPTASGGSSGSGIGRQYTETQIAGTTSSQIQSNKCEYQLLREPRLRTRSRTMLSPKA